MTVITDITELIGNTPLLRLKNFDVPEGVAVYAKLEMMNPGGSIKDRLGDMLIRDALDSGKVNPGGVIIEATAGNTGIGLALSARKYGLKRFSVSLNISVQRNSKLCKRLEHQSFIHRVKTECREPFKSHATGD